MFENGIKKHTRIDDDFPSPDPPNRKLVIRQGFDNDAQKYFVSLYDKKQDICFRMNMTPDMYKQWIGHGKKTIEFTESTKLPQWENIP